MAFDPDPFSQAYSKIFDALNAFTEFSNIVKLGNQINYASAVEPRRKESSLTADTPQVMLLDGGFTTNIQHTSNVGQVIQAYTLATVTGDERLQKAHFKLRWAAIRAITLIGKQLGTLEFVRNVNITDGSGEISQFEESKGIRGWTGIMTIVVEMYFTKTELET